MRKASAFETWEDQLSSQSALVNWDQCWQGTEIPPPSTHPEIHLTLIYRNNVKVRRGGPTALPSQKTEKYYFAFLKLLEIMRSNFSYFLFIHCIKCWNKLFNKQCNFSEQTTSLITRNSTQSYMKIQHILSAGYSTQKFPSDLQPFICSN